MEKTKITQLDRNIKKAATEMGVTEEEVRRIAREQLDNISVEEMSCALTYFCFRNGPVENMHAAGKLSQQDMKILNKFCNNKLFTFLTLLRNNELERLLPHLYFHKKGENWDKPEFQLYEPEDFYEEIEKLMH